MKKITTILGMVLGIIFMLSPLGTNLRAEGWIPPEESSATPVTSLDTDTGTDVGTVLDYDIATVENTSTETATETDFYDLSAKERVKQVNEILEPVAGNEYCKKPVGDPERYVCTDFANDAVEDLEEAGVNALRLDMRWDVDGDGLFTGDADTGHAVIIIYLGDDLFCITDPQTGHCGDGNVVALFTARDLRNWVVNYIKEYSEKTGRQDYTKQTYCVGGSNGACIGLQSDDAYKKLIGVD